MEQNGVQLDRQKISCSICLDLLKDPVTIPCGHSYCMTCIKSCWDEKNTYRCPQCRKKFTQRPALMKNTMLANLVEQLKTGLQGSSSNHCYAGPEDVACDSCPGRKLKALKSCLVCLVSFCENHLQPHFESPAFEKHKLVDPSKSPHTVKQGIQDREEDVKVLQQEAETINLSADKAVEDSEKILTHLIQLLEKRRSELKQQIRSQQESEVSRVKELQEKLKLEIAELKQLSPCSPLLSNTLHIRHPSYFEGMTAVLSQTSDQIQNLLRDKWTSISWKVSQPDVLLPLPEPKTRAEFLKYACEVTLDPNTVNKWLLLSDGNRKVTFMEEEQSYPSHPDRYMDQTQVLSKQTLTGRCYWEVEHSGAGVGVAVTYKRVRKSRAETAFGDNYRSWVLYSTKEDLFMYKCNKVSSPFTGMQCSRIGVYLDHSAGVLSFYSVTEAMILLHKTTTRFTRPLFAGIKLGSSPGDSAEFIQLK